MRAHETRSFVRTYAETGRHGAAAVVFRHADGAGACRRAAESDSTTAFLAEIAIAIVIVTEIAIEIEIGDGAAVGAGAAVGGEVAAGAATGEGSGLDSDETATEMDVWERENRNHFHLRMEVSNSVLRGTTQTHYNRTILEKWEH